MKFSAAWVELRREKLSDKKVIKKIGFLGEILLDPAVIVSIEPTGITIIPASSCGPSGCKNCNLCASGDNSNKIFYKIKNAHKFKLHQEINIKRFVFNEAVAATTMFGIPILLALITQLIWYNKCPQTADSVSAILSTVGAMIFGIVIVYIIETLVKIKFPSKVEN